MKCSGRKFLKNPIDLRRDIDNDTVAVEDFHIASLSLERSTSQVI